MLELANCLVFDNGKQMDANNCGAVNFRHNCLTKVLLVTVSDWFG